MRPSFLCICFVAVLLGGKSSFAMNIEEIQQESRRQLRTLFSLQEEQNRSREAGQEKQTNKFDLLDESFLNLNKTFSEELFPLKSFYNLKNLEMDAEYLCKQESKLILKLSALPLNQLQSLKIVGNIGSNEIIQKNLDNMLSQTSQLKELFLSENKLKTIPKAIYRLQKLETLDISKNPHLKKLPKFLWKAPNLQKVTITSNLLSLNQVPEYIEILKNEEMITLLSSYKNKHKLSDSQIESTKNNLHFCKMISISGCYWNDETLSWAKASSKSSSKIVKLKNSTIANAIIDYIKGKSHWNAVAKLMSYGINIGEEEANSFDKYGIPLLVKASESGRLNVVQYLVEHGANINARTKFENTALMGASLFGHLDIVKYLIKHGANVNNQNAGGETALMRAAGQKHLDIVKYLILYGANIDTSNRFGDTALMKGAYHGYLNIVKYLTKHGADVNARDISGNTVLMQAVLEGQLNIVKYLIQNGAKINDQNKYEETALIKAIKEEQLRVADYLIKQGADTNIKDINGQTALYFARERFEKSEDENKPKYQELVELLESRKNPRL